MPFPATSIAGVTRLTLCLMLLVVTGCGGCRKTDLEAEKRAEELRRKQLEEDQKPDFEPARVCVLPASMPVVAGNEDQRGSVSDFGDLTESTVRSVTIKPGHWMECWHQLKANKQDFTGRLKLSWSDRNREPWLLERSKFQLVSSRPLALPKGQSKLVDATTFVAVPNAQRTSKLLQLESQLETRNGAIRFAPAPVPSLRLRPHQFFFPVLAANPERYGYLKVLPSIQPPGNSWNLNGISEDYFVVLPNVSRKVPLPQHGLAWTTIAYVLIDDFDTDVMSLAQQTAMVDWLHWGGQIIISGPSSLERLQGTFLEPHLPALPSTAAPITEKQVAKVNGAWSRVPGDSRAARESFFFPFSPRQPMEVLQMQPVDEAAFVPKTANLVAAKRVGRGRVVVTAFSLTDSRIINWRCFDNFLNGCLLQRPPRRFSYSDGGFPVAFIGSPAFGDARPRCGLRYFTRDARVAGEQLPVTRNQLDSDGPPQPGFNEPGRRASETPTSDEDDDSDAPSIQTWEFAQIAKGRGFAHDRIAGVAGWSDFSSAANASRESLNNAAGITVPDKGFISRILLVYLVCLVPLNWLVFRLLGRLEWAWFAAPLIAVFGALAVIQLAQLDIGFARSRTDISIIELQGDYARAHVTTYSGLYSSLTTRYSADFEDPAAQALPFSTNPTQQQLNLRTAQPVALDHDRKLSLDGYPVFSNSTGMLHTEQMVEMAGSLRATVDGDTAQLNNGIGMRLWSVVLLRRQDKASRIALLPELDVDDTAEVRFDANELDFFKMLERHPVTASATPLGEVSLRDLYELATDGRQLEDGQMRLIAWTDDVVSQAQFSPQANQMAARTLVVANLHYERTKAPRSDVNSPDDIALDAISEFP